jgi:putative flippase GtrA
MKSNKWKDFKNRIKNFFPHHLLKDFKPELRFIRFLVVGTSGLVINNLCLVLLTELSGIHYLVSAVMATQCSTLWNFTFTEIWVFSNRDSRSPLGRLVRFFLMNNAALLLRGPLLQAMVSALGIHYLLANLITLFVIAMLRFFLSDKWIWTPSIDEEQKETFTYDIHHIIGIDSWIRLPELEYFRVPELGRAPDIRLRQESRKMLPTSPQSILYNDGLGRFGFELSIERGDVTEIQVSALVRKSPHVLYTNIFEPVLRWTFVRKGYALVHAACVILKDQAVLVTAQTDTGKTSTILRIIDRHKAAFISDDMTILDRDGRLYNFPKPLTISSHTLNSLRNTNLNFKERLALQFQSRIHSRTGRKLAFWLVRSGLPVASINSIVQILIPPPKYMVNRLIPDVHIVDSAQLSHIFQIERGADLRTEVGLEEILKILYRNAEDAYGFPPYPELAGPLSSWRKEDLHTCEHQIIRSAVNGCRSWRLGSPTYSWWKKLPDILKYDQLPVPSVNN